MHCLKSYVEKKNYDDRTVLKKSTDNLLLNIYLWIFAIYSSFQYRYQLCPDVVWHTCWFLVSARTKLLHCVSSVVYAKKSATIYRYYFEAFSQLSGLQKHKISLRKFFVGKNPTRIDYCDAALLLFYYCFLQVSLFVDLYKKKQATPKNF